MEENVHTIFIPYETFEKLDKDIYFEFEMEGEEYEINDILCIIGYEKNGGIDPEKPLIKHAEFTHILRTPQKTIVGIKVLRSEI